MSESPSLRNQSYNSNSAFDLNWNRYTPELYDTASQQKRFVEYFNQAQFPYHRWQVCQPTTSGYSYDNEVDHSAQMFPNANQSYNRVGMYAVGAQDFWMRRATFKVRKQNSPTGSICVRVYDRDGTTVIGQSGYYNVASLSTSYSSIQFIMKNTVHISQGCRIVVCFDYQGGADSTGSSSNYVQVSLGHHQQMPSGWETTNWTNSSGSDQGWSDPTVRPCNAVFDPDPDAMGLANSVNPSTESFPNMAKMGTTAGNPTGLILRSSGTGHRYSGVCLGADWGTDSQGQMFNPQEDYGQCGFITTFRVTTGTSGGYINGLASKHYYNSDSHSMAIQSDFGYTNMHILSSDGTTQSVTDAGVSRDGTNFHTHKVVCNGALLQYYRDGNFCQVKTNNIPTKELMPCLQTYSYSNTTTQSVTTYYEAFNRK